MHQPTSCLPTCPVGGQSRASGHTMHLHASTDGDSVYIQPITARVNHIQGDTTASQSNFGKTEATGVTVILAAGCVAFGVLTTPVLALAVCRLSHRMQLGGGTEYPPTPEQKTTPLVPRHMAQTHRCWTVEDQCAAAILHAAIDMDQPGQQRDPVSENI